MFNTNIIDDNEISDIFIKAKRESATDIVIKNFKGLLVTNILKPGDKLPSEMEISQSLGVSRGSVREAMKILSAYGIVSIKRGDGTYVADNTEGILFDPLLFRLIVNSNDVNDSKELREMIELGIIKLAIENATEEDIKRLEEVHDKTFKMVNNNLMNAEAIIETELMFHTALGKATGNKMVQAIYNFVMELYVPNIYKDIDNNRFGEEALECHKPIIDAIKNRDLITGEEAIKHSVDVWKYLYNNYKG
ncbi:MAG: FadR/GntR family transcriptional regulator [Sedimentibacter sp.]